MNIQQDFIVPVPILSLLLTWVDNFDQALEMQVFPMHII